MMTFPEFQARALTDDRIRNSDHGIGGPPLEGIDQDAADNWRLGYMRVHKHEPTYRDGWGTWQLHPGFHFYKRRFDLAAPKASGWAIIFRMIEPRASPLHEWLCGWVPLDREKDADTWIVFMNQEIASRLRAAEEQKARDLAMTDGDHVRVMLDGGRRGEVTRLIEAADSWGFGGTLWLSKTEAKIAWGVGDVRELAPTAHFYLQPFHIPLGVRGDAIWFAAGPVDPTVFLGGRSLCGWVSPERASEARRWVDFLNAEIRARLAGPGPRHRPERAESLGSDADHRLRASLGFIQSLGIPAPKADTMDEFMTKLEAAAADGGPIDARRKDEPR